MPVIGSTPNFALRLPYSNRQNWTDYINGNFKLIDSLIATYVSIASLQGLWTNNFTYAIGDSAIDESSGVIYTAQVEHTSSGAPATFLEDRTAHPTYWLAFNVPARNRGAWVGPDTAYLQNDFVLADSTKYAVCLVAHVSTASFDVDVLSGYWEVLIDISNLDATNTVSTIAELKALITRPEAVVVETGQAAGIWQWELASTTTADDALVVTPTSGTAGRYKRIIESDAYHAVWWGASPSASAAANTTAINAAIAAANAASVGKVLLGSGSYSVTSLIMKAAVSLQGVNKITTRLISATASAKVLDFTDISTYGIVISDMSIEGDGSTTTGIYVGSTLEETSHMVLRDLRIWNHAKGLDGGSNYALFDSEIISVDFLECDTFGLGMFGSQLVVDGCKFRVCGEGVRVYLLNTNSVGGGTLVGCTWIQNTYDIGMNGSTIRQLNVVGGWFEQTVTMTIHKISVGAMALIGLAFNDCLFQPAATATGNGIEDIDQYTGSLTFNRCRGFTSPYASTTFPSHTYGAPQSDDAVYQRIGCYTTAAGIINTLLADVNINPNGHVLKGIAGTELFTDIQQAAKRFVVGFTNGNAAIIGTISADNWFLFCQNTQIGSYTTTAMAMSTSITSSSATGGVGYATGAGGTVAQGSGSGKATTVVLNKATGLITLDGAVLNAATIVSFTLTCSAIATTDTIILNHVSGGTIGAYTLNAQAGSGAATINVRNATAGNLTESPVIRFTVIKSVSA